jgi:hypothetical protein
LPRHFGLNRYLPGAATLAASDRDHEIAVRIIVKIGHIKPDASAARKPPPRRLRSPTSRPAIRCRIPVQPCDVAGNCVCAADCLRGSLRGSRCVSRAKGPRPTSLRTSRAFTKPAEKSAVRLREACDHVGPAPGGVHPTGARPRGALGTDRYGQKRMSEDRTRPRCLLRLTNQLIIVPGPPCARDAPWAAHELASLYSMARSWCMAREGPRSPRPSPRRTPLVSAAGRMQVARNGL